MAENRNIMQHAANRLTAWGVFPDNTTIWRSITKKISRSIRAYLRLLLCMLDCTGWTTKTTSNFWKSKVWHLKIRLQSLGEHQKISHLKVYSSNSTTGTTNIWYAPRMWNAGFINHRGNPCMGKTESQVPDSDNMLGWIPPKRKKRDVAFYFSLQAALLRSHSTDYIMTLPLLTCCRSSGLRFEWLLSSCISSWTGGYSFTLPFY